MDVIRHVRTEKGIAGLYRGMAPTLTREMAGNATMFAIYEMLKRKAAAMQVYALLTAMRRHHTHATQVLCSAMTPSESGCPCWRLQEACKLLLQGLQSTKELGVGSLMIAGGLGGVAYWGPVYPADVIKSRMQVDDLKNPQFRGMLDCFKKVVSCEWCCAVCWPDGPAKLCCSHPMSLSSLEAFMEPRLAESALILRSLLPTSERSLPCRHWPMTEWEGCIEASAQQ